MTEYERFGLVFTKTQVYKFGHWLARQAICFVAFFGGLRLQECMNLEILIQRCISRTYLCFDFIYF